MRRLAADALRTGAFALSLASAACAVNPVSGRPEFTLMSAEREAEIGAEESQRVAAEMGLVDDAALAEYVSELGARLAAHSPRRDVGYAFHVVDIEEPNAFALPGGYVYVSRGLLVLTNSEAELANVIGHEIGHVAARHAAQRQTRAAGVGLLTLGTAILGAALGAPGELLGSPLQALGAGLVASYSREQEREADRIGQDLALRAGIDPHGMPQLLATLGQATRLRGREDRLPSFFDSQPTTPDRVATTRERADSLEREAAPVTPSARSAYLERLEGLRVGGDPAQGVLRGSLYLHPDLDFALRFPEGWTATNSRSAVGAVSPAGDARLLLGIQDRGSDPRQAGDAFLRALSRQTAIRVVERRSGEIGSLPGHRALLFARTPSGVAALHVTWVAHRGLIFRLIGSSPGRLSRPVQAALDASAGSFRPLAPDERAAIRETRLAVVAARAGEGLAPLGARSANAWSPLETAVYNGLAESAALRAGWPVKIARSGRYRPRR